MESSELANVLNSLGTDGLRAFIVYQVCDLVECITVFGLLTWGIRTVWKWYKVHHEEF